jgi:hypothetical protein
MNKIITQSDFYLYDVFFAQQGMLRQYVVEFFQLADEYIPCLRSIGPAKQRS